MKHRSSFVLLAALALLTIVALSPGLAAPLPAGAGNPAPAAVSFTLTRLTDNAAEDTRPTLAVDSTGKAHVVYERDGDIYYATNAGGSWATTAIATSADDAYRPAIAVDGSDHAHVAYFSGAPPTLDLYYATNAGGSWATELAGDVAMPATWNLHLGLALDSAGQPYIVYHAYNSSEREHEIEIRYRESSRGATPQGGWVTLPVTDNAADDMYPSIALDGTGAIHVAYQSTDPLAFSTDIWHATYGGSNWNFDRITNSTWRMDEHPSLALDGSHKAHVAWQVSDAGSTPEIVYGTDAGGTWITTTLTANVDHDTHPSLATDGSGKVHVVYEHFGDRYYIHYASNASGTWFTDTVASATNHDALLAGNDYALAVDDAGYVHAVYHDDDGNDDEVWYARSDQPVGPPANQPPHTPADPTPCHPCTGVGIEDNLLSWSGGDPDGDTVTYDVSFGTTNPPPQVQSGWAATTLTVALDAGIHYYWQVVARDEHSAETAGPLWEFTTSGGDDAHRVYLPLVLR
ncbi:MAG: hypothetical protein ACP5HM_10835 [Anaerolineae bacterium]